MGFFDFLPCCGSSKDNDDDSIVENATLLPPNRGPASIISQENYGSTSIGEPVTSGLTGEQRQRIEEIGREVGNHMLPIHHLTPRAYQTSPQFNKPSNFQPIPVTATSSSPSSSRPSSPSPLRPETSPAGGVMRSPKAENDPDEELQDGDGVVRKTVFLGGLGNGGATGRKPSGRGRGRGRGRGAAHGGGATK